MAASNTKFLLENKLKRQEIFLSEIERKKLLKHGKKLGLDGVKATCEKIIRDYIKDNKLKA